MSGSQKRDLSMFGKRGVGRKMTWADRKKLIEQEFPSTKSLDWKRAFDADIDLFGRIIRDILKIGDNQPGRPGPRPQLDEETAAQRFRELMGDDYTVLPFADAFRALAGDRSIRHVATKTGLDRNAVDRLMKGTIQPDAYQMEKVAAGFGRDPSYFLEYRMLFISAALLDKMASSPESTVGLYRKIQPRRAG